MRKWIIRLNNDRSFAVLSGLTVVAAVLRLRQYAVGRSFWLDELAIGHNIVNRSFLQLLSEPLGSDQVAPPGFLAIASLTKSFIGAGPQALRLVPLGFSLGGLLAAWLLARRNFSTLAGQASFVGLVGFAPVLIYYSSEFKQYSGDVAVTILLLLAFSRRHEPRGLLVLGSVGAASVWFSHPSLIVLLALGGLLALEALRNTGRLVPTIGVGVAWGLAALGFLAHTWLIELSDEVQTWWLVGYAPLPTSRAGLEWYHESVSGLIYLLFRQKAVAGRLALEEWFYSFNYFLLAATALAATWAGWRRRIEVLLLATVGTVAVIAAGVDAYPFRGRAILYLLPILAFVIASAVDEAALRAPRFGGGLALAIILVVAIPSAEVFFDPHNRFDIEAALELIEEVPVDGSISSESYDVDQIVEWAEGRRVWFVAAFPSQEDQALAEAMTAHDAVVKEWSDDGVYLRLIVEAG